MICKHRSFEPRSDSSQEMPKEGEVPRVNSRGFERLRGVLRGADFVTLSESAFQGHVCQCGVNAAPARGTLLSLWRCGFGPSLVLVHLIVRAMSTPCRFVRSAGRLSARQAPLPPVLRPRSRESRPPSFLLGTSRSCLRDFQSSGAGPDRFRPSCGSFAYRQKHRPSCVGTSLEGQTTNCARPVCIRVPVGPGMF